GGAKAEMVVDGETGLLVPADADALAAAILRLAAAPEVGARMAAAARAYVVDKHSHLQAAAAYAAVYANAISAIAERKAAKALAASEPGALTGGASPVGGPTATPGRDAPSASVISVQGFSLDVVGLEEAARWVIEAAGQASPAPEVSRGDRRGERGGTKIAVSFNPELVIRAERDPGAAEALLQADLCYPDGVGAVWAAGRLGAADAARVPGVDLAQRVLELAVERGLSVYFLGAAEGVVEKAAVRQSERLPGLRIAGTHHGYFSPAEEEKVVGKIRESGARVLLVAMGAPRQEIFMYRHRHELGAGVALGVGGSFDVWAGTVKRAPGWAQRARAEWLYRLLANPRRARRQAALLRYAGEVVLGSPDDYGPPRRGRARAGDPGDRASAAET
ncbi:MAG: WecB/TagA/CpsF family glycosyltransferase, partial [Actinobacteria bacterium]|nr:WecB/TagA/CpsF family glycosyltransferase [Actinomycetota bacterium]